MIETIGQSRAEAYTLISQVQHADTSSTGSASHDETMASRLKDQYIPTDEYEASGIYTRENLLRTAEKAMRTVLGLEEDHDLQTSESDKEIKKTPELNELDEGDEELVRRLRARDVEVRMHEQAHAAAAGEYVRGAPSYNYQRGPDGKMYAIGGSLAVDVGKEATAGENARKAMILRGAALGVAEPSSADAMVAMQANDLMRHSVRIQA